MSIELARMLAYVVVMALSLATGWQVHAWKAGSDSAAELQRQAEADAFTRSVVAEVASKTLDAIDAIKITNTTIVQKVRHEIIKEPMPVDCRIPASWMLQINNSRANGAGAAKALPEHKAD